MSKVKLPNKMQEASDEIAKKVKESYKLLCEAETLSDKFGVEFNYPLFGGYYTPIRVSRDTYPELDDDEFDYLFEDLPKEDIYGENSGWMNSSSNC